MGPDLPSRPRFSWDIKTPPWTDGKGSQEGYFDSLQLWKQFHDALQATNPNKIPSNLQGIVLKSQLYGRAKDIVKRIPSDTITADDGALAVAKLIHKVDPLSKVSECYERFTGLLQTKRGSNESLKNVESRFFALVCRFNDTSDTNDGLLPDSLVSFMLLANCNIDNNQRIAILAASAPKPSDDAENSVLDEISYESVASIIRSSDNPTESRSSYTENLYAHSAQRFRSGYRKQRKRLAPHELADLKSKSICRSCGVKGHWANDNICHKSGPAAAKSPIKHSHLRQHHLPQHAEPNGNRTGSVAFFMGTLSHDITDGMLCPLVDDGAPYSGLGMQQLTDIAEQIMVGWNGQLGILPSEVRDRPFWQYGSGSHASMRRRILGTIVLSMRSDQNEQVDVAHLVIEGSSRWVIARNVTKCTDIIHLNGNYIRFKHISGRQISTVQLEDHGDHSHIPLSRFFHKTFASINDPDTNALFAYSSGTSPDSFIASSLDMRRILQRVHEHVCGHASYSDMRTLLQRNQLWTDESRLLLSSILENCPHCILTKPPTGMRPVSLSRLTSNFNEAVCVDHFFLDGTIMFHLMDKATRYSFAAVVQSTKISEAIILFDTAWINMYWAPSIVFGDKAFDTDQFRNHLKYHDIQFAPIPARRHNKNAIESKHRVIRDVYLRLSGQHPTVSQALLAVNAVRVSNDLYGNDLASAYELAHGYSRPFLTKHRIAIPDKIREAHEDLIAKRKLNKIMRSHSIKENRINTGDMVQVYVKHENEKRGVWSEPKPVLKFDNASRTVTVSGKGSRVLEVAVEDVCHALASRTPTAIIQEAMDTCDEHLSEAIVAPSHSDQDRNSQKTACTSNNDFSEINNLGIHPAFEGDYSLTYAPGGTAIQSARIELLPGTTLSSSMQKDLKTYESRFGSKEFMLHETQGLPTHVTHNAYVTEESSFLSSCTKVHRAKVSMYANVIGSHVLYKIKTLDDDSRLCKARIAPHGNHDNEKETLKTDSASCPPVGFRFLLSICVIYRWFVSKIDVKSAFLQSGKAERDVYVTPPRECQDRRFLWLLDVATYGLVNANAKWQRHSDDTLLEIGLCSLGHIPQVFYLKDENRLVLLAVKVVDDILVGGSEEHKKRFIEKLKAVYTLGTIVHLPGHLKFFGISVTQDENVVINISNDDKMQEITPYCLPRLRRKDIHEPLNSVEKHAFQSINGSLGFLGMCVSPFTAFASSHLQQTGGTPTVHDLVRQAAQLKDVKHLGTTSCYKRPVQKGHKNLTFIIFADAGRPSTHGQLGFIGGLLIGNLQSGSIVHMITSSSHLSARPVKSIASAEVLASGCAIEEGKILCDAYSKLFGMKIHLHVLVDFKDLFNSLSTCRTPEDKSIRADVALLRYNFETQLVNEIIWISGSMKLADPLTKKDSPLKQPLQLTLFSGELPLDFPQMECGDSSAPLG